MPIDAMHNLHTQTTVAETTLSVVQWDIPIEYGVVFVVMIPARPDANMSDVQAKAVNIAAQSRIRGDLTPEQFEYVRDRIRDTLPTYRVVEPGERIWQTASEARDGGF